jgi:hypothetical protein
MGFEHESFPLESVATQMVPVLLYQNGYLYTVMQRPFECEYWHITTYCQSSILHTISEPVILEEDIEQPIRAPTPEVIGLKMLYSIFFQHLVYPVMNWSYSGESQADSRAVGHVSSN